MTRGRCCVRVFCERWRRREQKRGLQASHTQKKRKRDRRETLRVPSAPTHCAMLARLLALHLENGHSVITPAATVAGARWLGSLAGAAELNGSAAAVRVSASDRAASHATASPSTGHWVGGRARASTFMRAGCRLGRAPLLIPRGFASGASITPPGDDGAPPNSTDGDDVDWGEPIQSLADMDDLLDDWEDLMEAGDLDGVLRLLEARTAGVEGLPPLGDVLASPPGEADERALRRALEAAQQAEAAARRVRLVDGQGRAYATGRRKAASARVWVRPGSGRVWVNGGPLDALFASVARRGDVLSPFAVTGTIGKFDVRATVAGGGSTGQAQAVRHGLARALQAWDPTLRPPLKAAGLLTRDPRVVERKKPGKAKARKSFQWVKR